ncbi:uncharacterized protein ACN427_013025 isoform 1-T1 [Glossina fuscipes fuscipes]
MKTKGKPPRIGRRDQRENSLGKRVEFEISIFLALQKKRRKHVLTFFFSGARLKSSREERGDAQASSDNSNTVISPIIVLLINNSHNSNSNLKAASVYLSHPTTANQPSTHFHPHPQQHEQQLRQHQGRQQQQLPPLLQRGVTSDQFPARATLVRAKIAGCLGLG